LVRDESKAQRLTAAGAEAVLGDLTRPETLDTACRGAVCVIATANAAVPSCRSDTFRAVEDDGYRNLVSASVRAGVSRFIYVSAPVSKHESGSPLLRFKRLTEERIVQSGMDHLILRANVFMDTAFPMLGSEIPVRGAEAATVLRPFPFAANHFARVKDSIERKHVAMVPGDGRTRHSFICADDVAAVTAAAVGRGPSGIHDLGGPEPLSFLDVVHLYEKLLGVSLRVKHAPAAVFRVMSVVLRPFNPAAANLMHLNYLGAVEDSVMDSRALSAACGVTLTSAESFLRGKIALAAAPAHA
jgi:uncharacterized protein YbjT (DUF2867 family)